MSKMNFYKLNDNKKIKEIKKFLKKHYINFFEEIPLLFCFIL